MLFSEEDKMSKAKKTMVLVLSLVMLIVSMSNVLAVAEAEKVIETNDNTRMYSTSISLGIAFVDGEVAIDCIVSGTLSTESITLFCVLREENEAGNLVMVDTWSDSGTGDYFEGEYGYSPAIKGREYELAVRVGIYDENGLVGYDYETISEVY